MCNLVTHPYAFRLVVKLRLAFLAPGVTTSFDDVDVTEAFGKTANERQYTRMTARSLKRVRRNVTNRVFGS